MTQTVFVAATLLEVSLALFRIYIDTVLRRSATIFLLQLRQIGNCINIIAGAGNPTQASGTRQWSNPIDHLAPLLPHA